MLYPCPYVAFLLSNAQGQLPYGLLDCTHTGSCGFGQIDKDKDPLGWDVVAVPDVSPDYAGSCGTCFELMCDPSAFKDGYGQSLDRTSACYDTSKSVIARVVDTCPCVYPDNAFSNKRWQVIGGRAVFTLHASAAPPSSERPCTFATKLVGPTVRASKPPACPCRCCGDMPHLDVSAWAFEKLADKKWGVIGLKFRRVPCEYKPGSPATPVANPSAGVGVEPGGQEHACAQPWA